MKFWQENKSVALAVWQRVPWLLLLLVLGLAVSGAVGAFEGVIARFPVLVAFQSLILGMAGNTATQSLALTVRGLAQAAPEESGGGARRILREVLITLLCGVLLGVLCFALVTLSLFAFDAQTLAFSLRVGGCVGGAMCLSMALSGLAGAGVPLLLCRFGADPAVASGPLITTAVDLVSVLLYYGLSIGFLNGI